MTINNDSKVIILTHSLDPEKICAAAAKISSTYGSAIYIYEKTDPNNAGNLISKVLKMGHKSFIEHVTFTIAFENVSAFVEQFMIEFRLASFTIKSRRYVNFGSMGYYFPNFRFNEEVTTEIKQNVSNSYLEHMDFLFSEYNFLVENGVPKEDARFILPYSYKSNFYCTVNARELLHIIYSAMYGRGRRFEEISNMGNSLFSQAKKICPSIFENIKLLEKGNEEKEDKFKKLVGGFFCKRIYDNGLTELISYTGDPENVVAMSAIINHTLCTTDEARRLINTNYEVYRESIKIACQDKRKRELEQINFTFRINNISLAGLTHLVRHRMQSINIPSFTEFGMSDKYIKPDSITSDLVPRYNAIWEKNNSLFNYYKSVGVVEEDLVYLYLSGNVLDVITTMNARELFHFIQLRSCNRAQWEIRFIAIDMLKKLRKIAPNIFKEVGPACYMLDVCPEGKFSCGKSNEVKNIFGGY